MTRISLTTFFLILFFSKSLLFASSKSEIQINYFILSETLAKNNKLAVIACDSLENPLELVEGTFQFSVNGFNYPLHFIDGVAVMPNKIDNSTFVYLRHENLNGSHSALFYILKKKNTLQTYRINWLHLLLIPALLIILTILFKRFLWIAIILFLTYLYFNYNKGLEIIDYLKIVYEGLSNIF